MFFILLQYVHKYSTYSIVQYIMPMTGTYSITFHVIVRSVTIELRQKDVALQVAGPSMRICGEKINIYLLQCLFKGECDAMCRLSSVKGESFQLLITVNTPFPYSHRSRSRR